MIEQFKKKTSTDLTEKKMWECLLNLIDLAETVVETDVMLHDYVLVVRQNCAHLD